MAKFRPKSSFGKGTRKSSAKRSSGTRKGSKSNAWRAYSSGGGKRFTIPA